MSVWEQQIVRSFLQNERPPSILRSHNDTVTELRARLEPDRKVGNEIPISVGVLPDVGLIETESPIISRPEDELHQLWGREPSS